MSSSDLPPSTPDDEIPAAGKQYANVIPFFDTPFFMTPAYEQLRQRRRQRLADGTLHIGISPDTGQTIHALPNDLSPHPFDFCLIRGTDLDELVRSVACCGYTDWRIPSPSELTLMCRDRDEIRGFGSEWYWTSCLTGPSTRTAIRFPDGLSHTAYLINAKARLRLVRDVIATP